MVALFEDVTQSKVAGLLQQRRPEILETADPVEVAKFEARVRGAAVEVVLLTGVDPPSGPIRDMAVEAIALQTGSEIEYAEYPEQQAQGLDGRGYHLHQRYLELLARLNEIIADLGGVPADGGTGHVFVGGSPPAARGTFPAAPVDVDEWGRVL